MVFIYSFIKTHSSSDMSYKYSSPVCLHVPNSVFRINVFHFYKTQGIIFSRFFFLILFSETIFVQQEIERF